jgi:hypothetical protein
VPDLSQSRAYQVLRADISRWSDENVRAAFLKDWAKAPREEPAGER